MADYMAAQITLGGIIPHHLVADLCAAISQEALSLEWGDCDFSPTTAQELLEACSAVHGAIVLGLYDDQATWGEFPELEAFLQEHDIPFDRFHEGKYDVGPVLRQFRPGAGCRDFDVTTNGEVVVPISSLHALKEHLATARRHLTAHEPQSAIETLQAALDATAESLVEPTTLPALEIGSAEPNV